MTTQTPCQYSQQLLWHFVSIAKDYVETRFFANTFLNYFCKFICGRSIIFYQKKSKNLVKLSLYHWNLKPLKDLKGQCHEIFDPFFLCLKDSIWAPHSQWLRRHAIFFKIIVIGYVNPPNWLFFLDCSFNICQKPLKFSKSVCVVY